MVLDQKLERFAYATRRSNKSVELTTYRLRIDDEPRIVTSVRVGYSSTNMEQPITAQTFRGLLKPSGHALALTQ